MNLICYILYEFLPLMYLWFAERQGASLCPGQWAESGAEKLLDNQARPSDHSAMQCIRKGEQAADVIINP